MPTLLWKVKSRKESCFYVDFKDYKPRYIFFEHNHLTYNSHRIINSHLTKTGIKFIP
jgi:hypothetical protein